MICPHCYSDQTKVTETRRLRAVIHRKRRCLDRACKKPFFTSETVSNLLSFPAEIRSQVDQRLKRIRNP